MTAELKHWKSLTKEQKAQIKQKHNITKVTFQFIEKVYEDRVN